mmetsp:Transcript_22578/g.43969  ORF Transcript_22578/g.43969 Transcript_22578/m.43969 type:complete len:160 (-) Transcript_22578:126-605(-)
MMTNEIFREFFLKMRVSVHAKDGEDRSSCDLQDVCFKTSKAMRHILVAQKAMIKASARSSGRLIPLEHLTISSESWNQSGSANGIRRCPTYVEHTSLKRMANALFSDDVPIYIVIVISLRQHRNCNRHHSHHGWHESSSMTIRPSLTEDRHRSPSSECP